MSPTLDGVKEWFKSWWYTKPLNKGRIEFDGGCLWHVYAKKPRYGHYEYYLEYVGARNSEDEAKKLLEEEYEHYYTGGAYG